MLIRANNAFLILGSLALGFSIGCSAGAEPELDSAEAGGEEGDNSFGSSSGSETVVRWNNNSFTAMTGSNAFEVFRGVTMVHIAMHDGANAVARTYNRYALGSISGSGADATLTAAKAAHDVLLSLRPDQQSALAGMLQTDINRVSNSRVRSRSLEVGAAAAQAIVSLRTGDGMFEVVPYAPANPPVPGRYQFTPGVAAGACPQCPFVTPFALASGDEHRAAPPVALTSAEWARNYNTIKDLGRVDSTTRTADQTNLAKFFFENTHLTWNRAARDVATRRQRSLTTTARAFAMMNTAIFDALVSCWDSKYYYEFWRPLTAIRAGDTDGNDATAPDPSWEPLGVTPGHPEYTAGHPVISQAAALALTETYGNSQFTLFSTTPAPSGSTRTFRSFRDAAIQAGQSRVFAGIHYPFSVAAGIAQGTAVAEDVMDLDAWEERDY